MDREPDPARPAGPTPGAMLEQVVDLSMGLSILLLPLFVIAVPGIILLLIAPALLLLAVVAAPVAVAGALIAPPLLIARSLRRRSASRR